MALVALFTHTLHYRAKVTCQNVWANLAMMSFTPKLGLDRVNDFKASADSFLSFFRGLLRNFDRL